MKQSLRQQGINFTLIVVAAAVILWIICTNASLLHYCSFTLVHGEPLLVRGDNYNIGAKGYSDGESCITSWHAMHLLQYCALGAVAPDLWYVALLLSVGFELWEMYAHDCHDQLDIFVNMLGFGIGAILNKTLL